MTEEDCVICGDPIDGTGANAQPVADGNCCHVCDMQEVIPARVAQIFGCDISEVQETGFVFRPID